MKPGVCCGEYTFLPQYKYEEKRLFRVFKSFHELYPHNVTLVIKSSLARLEKCQRTQRGNQWTATVYQVLPPASTSAIKSWVSFHRSEHLWHQKKQQKSNATVAPKAQVPCVFFVYLRHGHFQWVAYTDPWSFRTRCLNGSPWPSVRSPTSVLLSKIMEDWLSSTK